MKIGELFKKRSDLLSNAVMATAETTGADIKQVWGAAGKRHMFGQALTPAELELVNAVEAAVWAERLGVALHGLPTSKTIRINTVTSTSGGQSGPPPPGPRFGASPPAFSFSAPQPAGPPVVNATFNINGADNPRAIVSEVMRQFEDMGIVPRIRVR